MSSPCAHFLLLVIFVSTVFCSAEIVTHLPGFNGPLLFHLETGYVKVEKEAELFYYFIHSEGNPREDPLFLWLNGGPGYSGFSGILFDVGPLNIVNAKYDGNIPSLVYNPYSWTKVANVIFLDYPIGCGFSFSQSSEDYDDVSDESSCIEAYMFLVEWFRGNPQFLSNPLYIVGDSYGGKIVPLVVHKLAEVMTKYVKFLNLLGDGIHHFYNLKGYAIGNPLTGELVDTNSRIPYAHGVGIIPDELFKEIEGQCEGEDYLNPNPHRIRCYNALDKFHNLYSELYHNYILEPLCGYASPNPLDMVATRSSSRRKDTEFLPPSPVPQVNCRTYGYYLTYFWANNKVTREALHIKKDTVKEWVRCNKTLQYTVDIPSTVEYHKDITTRGYRALIYSGDQDLNIPHVGTQTWIRSLNFSIAEEWRSWHVDGQVAGYTESM